MHLYWTGVAADLWRAGDKSLEWLLTGAVKGDVYAAGHAEKGNDIPVLLSTTKAEPVKGGYRFTGHKHFGSLTPVWTFLGLHGLDTSDPAAPKVVHAFMPSIPGVETFRGESYHTGTWPHEPVGFANKRVAVIGTGATGVQAITEIAKTVGHLTVFQRTPNWCAPLHNRPIDAATQARIKATYPETFAICRESFGCFIHQADPRNALEVSPEEREALFEKLYGEPGFGIWMGNFRDVLIDREANATITEFM